MLVKIKRDYQFIPHLFIEYLLCSRHSSMHQGDSRKCKQVLTFRDLSFNGQAKQANKTITQKIYCSILNMATIHSSSSFQETEFLSYPLWLDCRKQQFCWSLGPSTSNSLVASISLSWNGTESVIQGSHLSHRDAGRSHGGELL